MSLTSRRNASFFGGCWTARAKSALRTDSVGLAEGLKLIAELEVLEDVLRVAR